MENIQLTLESSTTSLSLNSDSIYLNPEIDGLAGLPEIRTTSGVNAGYNGGWTSAQFYDARLITIRGVIANSDISVVEDRRKALVGLLGQGRKEELTLHFVTAGGNSYVLNCRTISCEMALSGLARKQEFLIQLRADDPLIYDDGALATEAIVNVRRALGGFQIDFGLPLYIGGGVNETLVENGNETVYPVINLYGPLHSPTIINQTTNQQMQVLTDLDYTLTWVNPVEVTGDYILITNETDKESPLSSVELLGNTTQNTLSGKNLYDVSTLGTGTYVTVDSNGWITINRDNSAGSSTVYSNAWTSNLTHLATSTKYDVFMEVKSVSGNGGELAVTSTASGSGQFDSWQVFQITSLSAGTVYVRNPTTKSSFSGISNGLRTTLTLPAGKKCSITFRLSVLAYGTETSSTFSYEPYCGGIPSPNPDFPQTVQTTTGEQVVKMRGKNLLKLSIPDANSRKGLTVVPNNTGELTFSGTTTNSWPWLVDTGSVGYPAGTYRITIDRTLPYAFAYRFYRQDGTYDGGSIVAGATAVTATIDFTPVRIAILYGAPSSGTTIASTTVKPMIELGSTATAFEPYQSQSYEVNLGKNLFNKSAIVDGKYINSSGAEIAHDSFSISEYISVEPNTVYTYSGSTNETNYGAKAAWYDGSKTWISSFGFGHSGTITAPASARYVRFSVRSFDGDAETFQLELGSQATSYSAYFTPIELCKLGTYQDKIYKSGDDWFVHKEVGKYTFTGDESPSVGTASTNTTRCLINNCLPADAPSQPQSTATGASDYFEYRTNWDDDVAGIYSNTRAIVFRGPKTTIGTTQAAVKTWLTSTTPAYYYTLATPTDTQITNQALIDQLEALASSTLFVGVNNIALVPSGGAQGELSIDYFSAYTEDRDIVVIDSQARTITKNGADIYYLKADGSEFPTLAPGENTLYLTSEQTSDEGYAEIKFKQGYLSI